MSKLKELNLKDPKQFDSYMQHVLNQFKTPAEKKMKKDIIKKMNVVQKKRGRKIFKEQGKPLMMKILADVLTRYLIGDRNAAIKQLVRISRKIEVDIDQDNYNQQFSDTHRAILKVLKRIM